MVSFVQFPFFTILHGGLATGLPGLEALVLRGEGWERGSAAQRARPEPVPTPLPAARHATRSRLGKNGKGGLKSTQVTILGDVDLKDMAGKVWNEHHMKVWWKVGLKSKWQIYYITCDGFQSYHQSEVSLGILGRSWGMVVMDGHGGYPSERKWLGVTNNYSCT